MHMKIYRNYLCLGSIKACSKSGVFPMCILQHMLIESETCIILSVICHIVCNSFQLHSLAVFSSSFCPLQPSLLPSRCPSACSPCQAQLLLQTTWSVYKLCSEPCCSYIVQIHCKHQNTTIFTCFLFQQNNPCQHYFCDVRNRTFFSSVETVRVCVTAIHTAHHTTPQGLIITIY